MAFADALDEHVASIVAGQIAAYKLNGTGIYQVWKKLTGRDTMAGHITWDHISNIIEDRYREMNLLPPRKKGHHDNSKARI